MGGGQNDPQRNKCLRNSENRKKKIKKTINLEWKLNDVWQVVESMGAINTAKLQEVGTEK